jgi:NAD(P) transhydrogenase subunit beta
VIGGFISCRSVSFPAAYIAAAVLFNLSLGGLSGQESAKRAVWYGIVGMALAVVATVFGPGVGNWLVIVLMIAGGSALGYYVASRMQMTEMPQLVAALHSFVGLAAVFIGFNAHIEAARIAGMDEAAHSLLTGFAGILATRSRSSLRS